MKLLHCMTSTNDLVFLVVVTYSMGSYYSTADLYLQDCRARMHDVFGVNVVAQNSSLSSDTYDV